MLGNRNPSQISVCLNVKNKKQVHKTQTDYLKWVSFVNSEEKESSKYSYKSYLVSFNFALLKTIILSIRVYGEFKTGTLGCHFLTFKVHSYAQFNQNRKHDIIEWMNSYPPPRLSLLQTSRSKASQNPCKKFCLHTISNLDRWRIRKMDWVWIWKGGVSGCLILFFSLSALHQFHIDELGTNSNCMSSLNI